jgi:hypothetical protein
MYFAFTLQPLLHHICYTSIRLSTGPVLAGSQDKVQGGIHRRIPANSWSCLARQHSVLSLSLSTSLIFSPPPWMSLISVMGQLRSTLRCRELLEARLMHVQQLYSCGLNLAHTQLVMEVPAAAAGPSRLQHVQLVAELVGAHLQLALVHTAQAASTPS